MPVDEDGPVFAEPWEAQAFALVVNLHQKGVLDWSKWAQTLGAVIAINAKTGRNCSYYNLWLDALEQYVSKEHLTTRDELQAERSAWKKAALATPHGEPIALRHAVRATRV